MDNGLSLGRMRNIDVEPVDLFSESAAEGFHDRFFGRKAGGVLWHRVAVFFTIGLLASGKDALDERVAVLVDRFSYTLDFDDVSADAEGGH